MVDARQPAAAVVIPDEIGIASDVRDEKKDMV